MIVKRAGSRKLYAHQEWTGHEVADPVRIARFCDLSAVDTSLKNRGDRPSSGEQESVRESLSKYLIRPRDGEEAGQCAGDQGIEEEGKLILLKGPQIFDQRSAVEGAIQLGFEAVEEQPEHQIRKPGEPAIEGWPR